MTLTDTFQEPGVEPPGSQPMFQRGRLGHFALNAFPLGAPFGKMEGTYQLVTRTGDFFDVDIAPFTLSEPYTVH